MNRSVAAYVIALDKRLRSPDLAHSLRQAGVEVTIVNAIRGSSISPQVQARLVDQWGAWWHQGARLSAAQIGCALSHRLAYEQARSDKIEWALVVEDDAVCLPTVGGWLEDLSRWNPEEPTIVSFLSTGRHLPDRRRSPFSVSSDGRKLVPLRWAPASAVMYAMNSGALRVALSDSLPLSTRADWPVWSTDVRFLLAKPMPIVHKPGKSTITDVSAQANTPTRVLRALTKMTGLNFLIAPKPYSGRITRYWKHSLFPSLDWTFRKRRGKSPQRGDL